MLAKSPIGTGSIQLGRMVAVNVRRGLLWGGVDLGGSLLVLLTLAAAVANVGFLVLWLLGSRPASPATPRNARAQSREDLNYNNVQTQAIENLVKRGIVNERDIDIPSMLNMPIGSWRQLDA